MVMNAVSKHPGDYVSVLPGDRVRLVNVHRAMNVNVVAHVGEEGIILGDDSTNWGHRRVLVKFDRTDFNHGEWWIRPRYLEKVDTTPDEREENLKVVRAAIERNRSDFKAKMAEKSEHLREEASRRGWAVLEGSESQRRWGEDQRFRMLPGAEEAFEEVRRAAVTDEDFCVVGTLYLGLKHLRETSNAGFWIARRDDRVSGLALLWKAVASLANERASRG